MTPQLVSVVMPLHNAEPFVGDALKRTREQDYERSFPDGLRDRWNVGHTWQLPLAGGRGALQGLRTLGRTA